MPALIAVWNSARGVWERPEANILCGHWALYWQTFPTSGSMRTGSLFRRLTSARRTAGNGFSSLRGPLMPTPQYQDGIGSGGAASRLDGRQEMLHTLIRRMAETPMLASPRASDGGWSGDENGKGARGSSSGFGLRNQSREFTLLPTPDAGVFNASEDPEQWTARMMASRDSWGPSIGMAARMIADGKTDLLPTPTSQLNEPSPWKPGVEWWLQARATRNLEGIVTGNTPMLPTPNASDYKGSGGTQGRVEAATGKLYGASSMDLPELVETVLLPTPDAGHYRKETRTSDLLPKVAEDLLATPQSRDWKGSPGTGSRERGGHQSSLPADIQLLPTPDTGTTPNGHGRRGGKPGNGHQSGTDLEATSIGVATNPPSGSGKPSSDDQLPGQLSLLDGMENFG